MKNRSFTALAMVGVVLALTAGEATTNIATLSAGTPCLEANFDQKLGSGTAAAHPFAFLVNTGAAVRSIVSVDLFMRAKTRPRRVAISIWSRSGSGNRGPATLLVGGTMNVGLTAAIYTTKISITLPPATDFFISVDNASGDLQMPISRSGTEIPFYHSPPTWIGPFVNGGFWNYRVNCVPAVPEEQLQAILDEILANEDLTGNVALVITLGNAFANLESANVVAAVNQLEAFIHQVEALINAGTLTQTDGDLLISMAQTVIDQLGG